MGSDRKMGTDPAFTGNGTEPVLTGSGPGLALVGAPAERGHLRKLMRGRLEQLRLVDAADVALLEAGPLLRVLVADRVHEGEPVLLVDAGLGLRGLGPAHDLETAGKWGRVQIVGFGGGRTPPARFGKLDLTPPPFSRPARGGRPGLPRRERAADRSGSCWCAGRKSEIGGAGVRAWRVASARTARRGHGPGTMFLDMQFRGRPPIAGMEWCASLRRDAARGAGCVARAGTR